MASTAQRRELLELILEVSFRREKVTLASGKQSDFYLDLRQTLMRPRGVKLAGELVLERLLAGPPVDAVGGMVPQQVANQPGITHGRRRRRGFLVGFSWLDCGAFGPRACVRRRRTAPGAP